MPAMRWRAMVASICAGVVWLNCSPPTFAQHDPPQKAESPPRAEVARLLQRFDSNKDSILDRAEVPERVWRRLASLDANSDGKVTLTELSGPAAAGPNLRGLAARPPERDLFRLLDSNNDGRLSPQELQKSAELLGRFDRNGDNSLDLGELAGSPGRRAGEVITPAAKGERHTDQLRVGELAPDFTLPDPAGKEEVRLSSFRGQKPVVLVFASYT